MKPTVGVLTFEQTRGKLDIGSTRIRGLWLTKHWPDAELFMIGRRYSTVIFQKAYWLDYARAFTGIKILDVCDPDFMDWDSDCIAMASCCDAVTTSTAALAAAISRYTSTRTICIPDRLDLDSFPPPTKNHRGNGNAQTAAWFGYSRNFAAVTASIPDLLHLGIRRLIVISEEAQQYELPEEFRNSIELSSLPWAFEKLREQLLMADVVLNYQFGTGRWQYKSNNKTLFAWAMGLPVAHSSTELSWWMSEQSRMEEAGKRLLELRDYDVRRSVEQYRELIRECESRPRIT